MLLQQQLAQAGVTVDLQKVDPSQSWDMLVAGDYDISVNVLDQRHPRPGPEDDLRRSATTPT